MKYIPWDDRKIDLLLDNIVELLILVCVVMVLRLDKTMLNSQEQDDEVSRSEFLWCLQMHQNDNNYWA